MRPRVWTLTCLMFFAAAASATTFVVPDDDELIKKSMAIAIGTVEGSYVHETEGIIETVYEIRVEQSLKALPHAIDLLRVVSPGGVIGDRALHVEAAAHFKQGERVLLFLTRHKGQWTPTDLTLGKFRFVTSTSGAELLVRDMEDVVGWDRRGQVHREQVRRRDGFLEFIDERLSGRAAQADYIVDASEVTLPEEMPERSLTPVVNAPFPGSTYTTWVSNQPTRWANMSAGVTFRKVASQNISGLADGGVSVIQNGLAAWTNECGSVINLIYGGTTSTPSTNFDSVHVVEFNDPQSRISGSWTGSGTIGITFNSYSSNHTFEGRSWWSITDADVVFQNGFPGTHGAFTTAMTHELGHGIGWRHSNQNHMTQGAACNSSVEQCTTAAIMNSSVNTAFGFSLQPWDVNAAQSVYPGGTCGPTCNPPVITGQPQSGSITSGGNRTLSVTVTGTAPFTYQWYIGASGNTSNPVSGATGASLTVGPSTTTSYWVRISNSCGTVNSAAATVTVSSPPPPPAGTRLRTDFNGDHRSDLFWRNASTGVNALWFMNGTVPSSATLPSVGTTWQPVAFGDFNGDGRSDIFWRNTSGANSVWLMNGAVASSFTTQSMAVGWNVDASGDFNNDGRWDLLWRNPSTGATQFWHMNGATPSVQIGPTIATSWRIVAAGDFDANGYYDVFWRNPVNGSNFLWLRSVTGIQEVGTFAMDPNFDVFGSGDFNGDGRSDIFFRHPETGVDIAWMMSGTSRTEVRFPTIFPHWLTRVVGDFNGDGTFDIAWHSDNGNNFMWLIRSSSVTSETGLPSVAVGLDMYGLK